MKKLFQNTIFKAFLLAVVPVSATILNSLTGDWGSNILNIIMGPKKWVIAMYLLNVFIITYYAGCEYNKNKETTDYEKIIRNKEKMIHTYETEIGNLMAVFDLSQDGINKLTKKVGSSNFDLSDWNFEMMANNITTGIHETIKSIAENGNSFSVNIYEKRKMENKKHTITMIAHEGVTNPKILGVPKLFKPNSKDNYFSIKMFVNNNPEPKILKTKEEIEREFISGSENVEKYSQYIGIPVTCRGNNMVALIEIMALHDSCIAETEDDIKKVINRYILSYKNLVLLAHKIEKNINTLASISKKEVGENENSRQGENNRD